jgi:hypothetical protein
MLSSIRLILRRSSHGPRRRLRRSPRRVPEHRKTANRPNHHKLSHRSLASPQIPRQSIASVNRNGTEPHGHFHGCRLHMVGKTRQALTVPALDHPRRQRSRRDAPQTTASLLDNEPGSRAPFFASHRPRIATALSPDSAASCLFRRRGASGLPLAAWRDYYGPVDRALDMGEVA